MLALERQKIILEYLDLHEVATTKQLCELTNASLATLRRDLTLMEQQGLLKRTHGGAQSILETPAHSGIEQTSSHFDPYLSFKDTIAKKAADFVNTNDIIFIGAGMTCNLLCKYIKIRNPEKLTVVTTNITAAIELSSNPNIDTLLLGGNIHVGTNHIETLDEYALQSREQLYFDKAFITVDGIDLIHGYSIINRAQLPLYHHLIRNSQQLYLLANDEKFDKRTFTHFCELDAIPNIITNSGIAQSYLDYYEEHDIQVVTV